MASTRTRPHDADVATTTGRGDAATSCTYRTTEETHALGSRASARKVSASKPKLSCAKKGALIASLTSRLSRTSVSIRPGAVNDASIDAGFSETFAGGESSTTGSPLPSAGWPRTGAVTRSTSSAPHVASGTRFKARPRWLLACRRCAGVLPAEPGAVVGTSTGVPGG